MRKANSAEITRLIKNTESSFHDTCTIDTKSMTRNGYGEEVAVYTSGSTIACDFALSGGDENKSNDLIVTKTKGTIRLPIETVVTIVDRITLTNHFGKTVTYHFEVISEPVKNIDCLKVDVVFIGV